MTQREAALAGKTTPAMVAAAASEGVAPEFIRQGVAQGTIAVPANREHRGLKPAAIGAGVRVKINANIGTSPHDINLEKEQAKLAAALEYGADAVMDLSTGGDLDEIRTALLARCPVPFGTVPIYQVMTEARSLDEVRADAILEMVQHHARQGVDFVTVHCGVTRAALPLLAKRVTGVVSRGGAFLVAWMRRFGRENPLYEQYDQLLDIAREYDVTLSLGDGLRPGCLADATDRAQLHELKVLGELTQRAWAKGVQVMVEGRAICSQRHRKNVRLQQILPERAVLCPGAWSPTWLRATTHRRGHRRGWPPLRAAFLCYVAAERLKLRVEASSTGGGLRMRPRRGYRPGPAGAGTGISRCPGPPGLDWRPKSSSPSPAKPSCGALPGQGRPVHHVRPLAP
jgi:phosphomethylpyrimidine synthase